LELLAVLGTVTAVLLLPLAAPRAGVAAVISAISVVCVLMVTVTFPPVTRFCRLS